MPLLAASARTSLAIVGAAGSLLGALVLTEPASPRVAGGDDPGDDGVRVEARFATEKLLAGATEHELAITIAVPRGTQAPPLSLVVALDRSGSMAGQPLADAKRAAHQLVDQLAPGDALSIVTYSSSAETALPMAFVTPSTKTRAHAAIEQIADEGGTCISCGLDRGTVELAASPIRGGVRRVVLISDGQANQGLWNRDELAEHAAQLAQTGVSISAVGVGLDFDEVTMVQLANVGRGNYHFVEDAAGLGAMFTRELDTLAGTVGVNAVLVVSETADLQVEGAIGYPIARTGDRVAIMVSDLHAGMTKVVLRTRASHAPGAWAPTGVTLNWQRVDSGARRVAHASVGAEVVEDRAEVDASVDHAAAYLIELARSAQAFDEARAVAASHGDGAARQVLERRTGEVAAHPYLLATDVERLRHLDESHVELLRTAPERGRMQLAATAYQLAR